MLEHITTAGAVDFVKDAGPKTAATITAHHLLFNRNHMLNGEGGAIPEEYHTAYVLDRTNTTGTVWLGLTANCAGTPFTTP